MAGAKKSKIILGFLFLFCLTVLIGCVESGSARKTETAEENQISAAEKKKAELTGRLDREFEEPQTHYELGLLAEGDGLLDKAEHYYDVALRFDPVYWPAQAAKVNILKKNGNKKKSELLADIYVDQAKASAGACIELGRAFSEHGLDSYAKVCFDQALELAPESPRVNKYVGYYYMSKGDMERAKKYFSLSFQIDPIQRDVAGELGRLGVVVKVPSAMTSKTGVIE